MLQRQLKNLQRQYSTPSALGGVLSSVPKYVRIVEVGPRDGLQNEARLIPTEVESFAMMFIYSYIHVLEPVMEIPFTLRTNPE